MCLVASELTLKIKETGINILVTKKKKSNQESPNLNDNVKRKNKPKRQNGGGFHTGSMPSM